MDDVVVDGISRTSRTTSSSFRAVLVSVGVGFTGFFFFTGFFSSEWVPGSTVGHRVFNSFTGFCLFVPRVEWVLPGFTGFF